MISEEKNLTEVVKRVWILGCLGSPSFVLALFLCFGLEHSLKGETNSAKLPLPVSFMSFIVLLLLHVFVSNSVR